MKHQLHMLYILNKKTMKEITKEKRIEKASIKIKELFEVMELDLTDPNLKDTPNRIAKMFINETLSWLYVEHPKVTTFPNEWKEEYNWMVVVKDIKVNSLCSHHFKDFNGLCHIAYIPGKKVIWLSKLARIVDYWSRRPQLQERLNKQIFNDLKEILETENIAVVINARHECMCSRWIKDPKSSTSTALMWGLFLMNESAKLEFFQHINNDR